MSRPKKALSSDLLISEPTKSREGYRISKDPMNWILQAGRVTLATDHRAKPENVGKVIWRDIGYYQSVTSLIRGFHQRVALTSPKVLPDSLNEATEEAYKLLERLERGLTVEIKA